MKKVDNLTDVIERSNSLSDEELKKIGIDDADEFFKTEIATKQIQDIFAPMSAKKRK